MLQYYWTFFWICNYLIIILHILIGSFNCNIYRMRLPITTWFNQKFKLLKILEQPMIWMLFPNLAFELILISNNHNISFRITFIYKSFYCFYLPRRPLYHFPKEWSFCSWIMKSNIPFSYPLFFIFNKRVIITS